MGLENINFPAAKNPERIEVAGFEIIQTPSDHEDYSFVTLRKNGVEYKTVIDNKTGKIMDRVNVTNPSDLREKGFSLINEVPDALQQAFGRNVEVEDSIEDDPFWTTPEAVRMAQAEALAKQRGDHRPDVV